MKILLGMSGGLDSSYSIRLLKAAGHTVEGAVLIMHGYTDVSGAREVARREGIRLHEIDCREVFEREVARYFAREYSVGRTPNPCTVCNRFVKIDALVSASRDMGFDRAATGHYARIGFENGRHFIKKGADPRKDQSYMLWKLTEDQLSSLYFPLGELKKDDVRALARESGMAELAEKKESQDICFLPDGNYAEFVEARTGRSPEGNFVSSDGKLLGRHKGIVHYTIGQRKGLGVALGERMFVSGFDPTKNEIVLKPGGGDFRTEAEITDINFQKLPATANLPVRCEVKVRYAAPPVPATLTLCGGDSDGNSDGSPIGKVVFSSPVRAVTPGQSAVFYCGDDLLLGGVLTVPAP